MGREGNIREPSPAPAEIANNSALTLRVNGIERQGYGRKTTKYPLNRVFKPEADMTDTISFKLNGKPTHLNVDGNRLLLWVLRTDLGLTGPKFGCGQGHCGCCTVLVNNVAWRSCLIAVSSVKDKEVVTIEGLEQDGKLHPVQKAFMAHDALQCGFCIPGQVLNAVSLLNKNPQPTREQIVQGMNNNFCRCGAHTRIIDAIQSAAAEMKGGPAQ